MLYLLFVVILAAGTAAMTKQFPQTRTRMGVVSLVVAGLSLAIAEVSGNLAFFYLASFTAAYGWLLLLIRVVGAAFDRGAVR